jgi:hypothetical protein
MDPNPLNLHLTRRQLFGLTARGIGIGALGSLLGSEGLAAAIAPQSPDRHAGGLAGLPHFAPRAKRVIFLHQSGGPSQLETFDYKPNLVRYLGTQIPDSIRMGQRVAQTMGQSTLPVVNSAYSFARYGKSGTWVSELLPHTAKIVDDITIIKTMHTDAINHDPAITFIQTGFQQPGRPSMGAWLSYGLGTMNRSLPSFMVLAPQIPYAGTQVWSNDFLPAYHQGTRVIPGPDPIPNLKSVARSAKLADLEAEMLRDVNTAHAEVRAGDLNLQARSDSFESARGMMRDVNGLKLIASPLKFSDTPPVEPMAPPEFGQHTDEVLQELFGWRTLAGKMLATLLTLTAPAILLGLTITGPDGKPVPAYLSIWPVFGASNQLLAALSLLGLLVWLLRSEQQKRAIFLVGLPMVFMMTMTLWALFITIQKWLTGIAAGTRTVVDPVGIASVCLTVLALGLIFEGISVLRKPLDSPVGFEPDLVR